MSKIRYGTRLILSVIEISRTTLLSAISSINMQADCIISRLKNEYNDTVSIDFTLPFSVVGMPKKYSSSVSQSIKHILPPVLGEMPIEYLLRFPTLVASEATESHGFEICTEELLMLLPASESANFAPSNIRRFLLWQVYRQVGGEEIWLGPPISPPPTALEREHTSPFQNLDDVCNFKQFLLVEAVPVRLVKCSFSHSKSSLTSLEMHPFFSSGKYYTIVFNRPLRDKDPDVVAAVERPERVNEIEEVLSAA